MPFILMCKDRPDAGDLRARTREKHLAYIGENPAAVLLAGPILTNEGAPCGSMIILGTDNYAAAKAFAENDPYAKAGLFADVAIKPYKIVTGALAPDTRREN